MQYIKTHLGIRLSKFAEKPIYKLYRFNVFDAGHVPYIHPESSRRNFNFQIEGESNEKLVVRIFLNKEFKIIRCKYFHLETFDTELAYYLTLIILEKECSQYPFDRTYKLVKSDI
jgi:hypothetical protein